MGKPVILVENLFSAVAFPDHTVTAEEEATGQDVWHVADGRRRDDDLWTPTTANSATWVEVLCDRVRSADMIVLDRGHNLDGYEILLQCSNDNFTTTETVFTVTLPAVSTPGDLDDSLGVQTEEGAWVKRFDIRSALYWRLYVSAMGASLLPEVVGLWLGKSLELEYLSDPFDDDSDDMIVRTVETPAGWIGTGQAANRRAGELRIVALNPVGYDLLRYHLQGHYGAGRPMWIVFDQENASNAVLAKRPPGRMGFAFGSDPSWGWRAGTIAWQEHEPAQL